MVSKMDLKNASGKTMPSAIVSGHFRRQRSEEVARDARSLFWILKGTTKTQRHKEDGFLCVSVSLWCHFLVVRCDKHVSLYASTVRQVGAGKGVFNLWPSIHYP